MKIIKQHTINCKNCGAEISHVYNHKCEYCGSMLDFKTPEEETIEVRADELVDITLREVMFEPRSNMLLLYFDGYKLPMPKVYEYDGNNTYISKREEYINPPKCYMCIEIDIYDFEKYGLGYLHNKILNSGIRFNELNNVWNQVLDNKEIRFFGGFR